METITNSDILKYKGLVVSAVAKIIKKAPPNVDFDELMSAGYVGLLNAFRDYNPRRSDFTLYAFYRIRGAILDELRYLDPYPRGIRKLIKRIGSATHAVESRIQEPAADYEIANELGVTIEEYHNAIANKEFSDTQLDRDENYFNLVDEIHKKEIKLIFHSLIKRFNKKNQAIIRLYYYHDFSMAEISVMLDLTEGRISQIHTKILESFKYLLEEEGFRND